MSLKINIPKPILLKPKISVFGVGGAGGNAVNNMIRSNLEGVDFVVANTDAQALSNSLAADHIQLGISLTKGLGAGSFPDRGRAAAEENIEEIIKYLDGNNMIFITAGMGGGTGTGAAPVIAKLAKERDILTVGVVTKPFDFEGKYRMDAAESGIEELKKYVDTLIVIPNQNLFRIANEQTTFESAFKMADNVLHAGVRGITDLITMPGLVNLDFADIKAIMSKMGKAMMGTGEAEGENRAIVACQAAISNPLLDDVSIKGARGVLVNMTGGPDMTLFEADMAVNSIRKEVDGNANIIFGSAFNDDMKGKIRISVVATGIENDAAAKTKPVNKISEIQTDLLMPNVLAGKAVKRHKAGFDPSEIKSVDEEVQKISQKDFKPTVSFEEKFLTNDINAVSEIEEEADPDEENTEYRTASAKNGSAAHQTQANLNNDLFADEEKFNQALEKLSKSEQQTKVRKPIEKPAVKTKKEHSGFSLFNFMNYSKKSSQIDEEPEHDNLHDIDEIHNSIENITPKTKRKTISKIDNKIAAKSYSAKSDEEDGFAVEDEDDILNVPAFFRRKNK